MPLNSALKAHLIAELPDLCGIIPPLAQIIAEYAAATPPPSIQPPEDNKFQFIKHIALSEDFIYVSDQSGSLVYCFELDGSFVRRFRPDSNYSKDFSPEGLACIDNCLYVSDSANARVCVFGSDGTLLRHFDVRDQPEGICFAEGLLFVTKPFGNRIDAYHLDGTLVRSFTSCEDDRHPIGIAYHKGRLYISNRKDRSVSIHSIDGVFIQRLLLPQSVAGMRWNGTVLVSVTADQIFVTDSFNCHLYIYSLNGHLIQQHGDRGNNLDQFDLPWGVVATDEWVFVADVHNHRIRCIQRNSLISSEPV